MAAHLTPGHTENFIPSHSFIDQNMEIVNHFPQMIPSDSDISQMHFQGVLGFSLDSFFVPVPEFPGNLADTFPGLCHENKPALPESKPVTSDEKGIHKGKKRKSVENLESSSMNSSQTPGNVIRIKNGSGRGKRVRENEKKEEKQNEVVHVRAKRGQATDSHSLAERLRREKINERLKCLQSIVPGCYKSMGMAVMLDEIINYVQSLQNQVEFLSMKLSAASAIHEFNTETDIMETMQRAEIYEAMKMQKLLREGWEGFGTQIGQKGIDFGFYKK